VEVARVALGLAPADIRFVPGSHISLGRIQIPLDSSSSLLPEFPRPPAASQISAADVLGSTLDPAVFFAEKIVLVGATAPGLGDRHHTASSRYGDPIPGVLVQAAAVQSILKGRCARAASPWILFAVGLATWIPLNLLSQARRASHLGWSAVGHAGVALTAAFLAGWLSVRHALTIGPSVVVFAAAASFTVEAAQRAAQSDSLRIALSRYVGMVPGAGQRHRLPQAAAVMFADLRGFSRASADLDPALAADLANAYLGAMARAVMEAGGVVDKFPGDAVLAVFESGGRDAMIRAVKAARKVREAVAAVSRPHESASSGGPMGVGVGIAYGPVLRAELGTTSRADLTVVGSTVNVAKALEDAAGPGQILLGLPALKSRAGPGDGVGSFSCPGVSQSGPGSDVGAYRSHGPVPKVDSDRWVVLEIV
jgi:adenylate cyclase